MFSLISQLSHVEITTPKPDKSLRFFTEVMGMSESGRTGQSVYLRSWRNFFQPRPGADGGCRAGSQAYRLAFRRTESAGNRYRAAREGWLRSRLA